MKRVVFLVSTGYVGSDRKELMEFDDDATDDDIQLAYSDWVSQYCEWWELGEDEDQDLI